MPTVQTLDDRGLIDRAMGNYLRTGPDRPDQPSNNSEVREYDNQRYLILRNVRATLAVYRLDESKLVSLQQWPAAFDIDSY